MRHRFENVKRKMVNDTLAVQKEGLGIWIGGNTVKQQRHCCVMCVVRSLEWSLILSFSDWRLILETVRKQQQNGGRYARVGWHRISSVLLLPQISHVSLHGLKKVKGKVELVWCLGNWVKSRNCWKARERGGISGWNSLPWWWTSFPQALPMRRTSPLWKVKSIITN